MTIPSLVGVVKMNNTIVFTILIVLLVMFGTTGCTQPDTPPEDIPIKHVAHNITEYSYPDPYYNVTTKEGGGGYGHGDGICSDSYVACSDGICHSRIETWCYNETAELEKWGY